MSVTRSFQRKIAAVRIRCGIDLLLRHTGGMLAAGGMLFAVALLAQRLFAVPLLTPWVLWGFGGIAGGLVVILWLLGLPSRMQACLLLDDRLKLHERFSTTLALAGSEDPFARAARAESLRAAERVDLRGHFPIRLSRSWWYGAAIWLAVATLSLYLPQQDLLGLLNRKQQRQTQAEQLEAAKVQIDEATRPIKALAQELGDVAFEQELKKLDEIAKAGDPQEMKQKAIKTLGDLSEKVKQMQGSARTEATEALRQMLKQLHGSANPFSQQIRVALAQGDYAQAANVLRQLQNQLGAGSLPDDRRQELAVQLRELARELAELADRRGGAEKELERLGLNRSLAEAGRDKLTQALQEQGLGTGRIEQLVRKMEAGREASGYCAGIGEALAGTGAGGESLSAGDLSEALEQLDALESLQREAATLRASLEEISRSTSELGQDLCKGLGGSSMQSQGRSGSGGSQGEGVGLSRGGHSITSDPLTANKTTRAPTRGGNDPVVASWYFRDTLVKGEARRSLAEVIQAGRTNAAEAVSDNQIPRRYEEAIKKYFNQLEKDGSD